MKYYGIDWKNTISKIIRPPVWPFGGIGTALTNNVISLPAGLALSHSVIHPFSYIYMYICISFSFRFSLSVSLATLSSIHFCSFFYSFLSPFFGMEGWGRGTALKKYPFSFLLNKVFRTWPRVWETKRKKNTINQNGIHSWNTLQITSPIYGFIFLAFQSHCFLCYSFKNIYAVTFSGYTIK